MMTKEETRQKYISLKNELSGFAFCKPNAKHKRPYDEVLQEFNSLNFDDLDEYVPHPCDCPICGLKDAFEDSDNYDTCPYCAWENSTNIDLDENGEHYSTVNGMTIEKAKEMLKNGLDTLGRPLKKKN